MPESSTPTSPGPASMIHTVGHGTLPAEEFAALLSNIGATEVVDIRAFPGSRRNPQFGTDEMARWLPEHGIAYSWARDLGGRRRPVADSSHVALRNTSFRAYADHMETEAFLTGVDALVDGGDGRVVMCSESVWWRCHRRLLADHLTLVRGVQVVHLMHDGRLTPHVPTDAVRVEGRRRKGRHVRGRHLVYDVGTPASDDGA